MSHAKILAQSVWAADETMFEIRRTYGGPLCRGVETHGGRGMRTWKSFAVQGKPREEARQNRRHDGRRDNGDAPRRDGGNYEARPTRAPRQYKDRPAGRPHLRKLAVKPRGKDGPKKGKPVQGQIVTVMPRILVDAECLSGERGDLQGRPFAGPVPVVIVSNAHIRIPAHALITRVGGQRRFSTPPMIGSRSKRVQTACVSLADILLADRCPEIRRVGVVPPRESPLPKIRLARRLRRARSWPICAPAATRLAALHRSARPTGRGSCPHWMRHWSACLAVKGKKSA